MAKSWINGKHYDGEDWCDARNSLEKTVAVRLSWEQLVQLEKLYPGKSISFAIRSCINDMYVRQNSSS